MSNGNKPPRPKVPLGPLSPASLCFTAVTTIALAGNEAIKIIGMIVAMAIFVLLEVWKKRE